MVRLVVVLILKNTTMQPPIYDLRNGTTCSSEFYHELELITESFLENAIQYAYPTIFHYKAFRKKQQKNLKDTDEILILQFLSTGLYQELYSGKALAASPYWVKAGIFFNRLRHRFPGIKKQTDFISGYIQLQLLKKTSSGRKKYFQPMEDFNKLVAWMDATGEFAMETGIMKEWAVFFDSLTSTDQEILFQRARALAAYFMETVSKKLGKYTAGVRPWQKAYTSAHYGREDLVLVRRNEEEYHLNMLGGEIMNRAMRQEFMQRKEKIVLMPACLRQGEGCQAGQYRGAQICSRCNPQCPVYRCMKANHDEHTTIVLFRHGSEFPRWIASLKNRKEYGIVGVACALNLMEGGYRLRKLGLPSQCVYLDSPGCKHHWNVETEGSKLNCQRLKEILSGAEMKEPSEEANDLDCRKVSMSNI